MERTPLQWPFLWSPLIVFALILQCVEQPPVFVMQVSVGLFPPPQSSPAGRCEHSGQKQTSGTRRQLYLIRLHRTCGAKVTRR